MKKLTVVFHLEKSGMEKKALALIRKYQDYTGFNQSQAIIQLVLRNEDYINSLCMDEYSEEIGRARDMEVEKENNQDPADKPDFVKRYEDGDRIDIFGNKQGVENDASGGFFSEG